MALGRQISVGIDIGTSTIKVLVCEQDIKNPKSLPRVIGAGTAESKGLRHGYINNINEVITGLKSAINQAEKGAGMPIRKAYISVGGIGLSAIISTGTITITKADNEVGEIDIMSAIAESEKELPNNYILNRKVIHRYPIEFRIDGKRVLGRPEGLKGNKLEVRTMYITYLSHHLNDILTALEEVGVKALDVIAAPVAASLVALTKTQKIAGCVLANIGAETTSIIVYENNIPVSLEVFPIGSNDITNDIALGLRVSIEDAELIKLGAPRAVEVPKRKLDDIVAARLSDIFEVIDEHLTKIDRSGLLPAGIILTGGGSGLSNIEEFARQALRLPSRQLRIKLEGNTKGLIRDHEWMVSYGLCFYALRADFIEDVGTGGLPGGSKRTVLDIIRDWFRPFLP